jgi:hypothetical protein
MPKPHLDYHELNDSLRLSGCPACDQGSRGESRYLEALLTDLLLSNLEAQRELAEAFGLCARHAGRAAEAGRALPAAIALDLVTGAVLRALEAPGSLFTRREAPVPTRPCPACQAGEAMGDLTLQTLAHYWQDAEVSRLYRESPGLCRPHLSRAHGLLKGHRSLDAMLQAEQEKYRALQADLRSFIRKQDYRFAAEPPGGEADAVRRAAAKLGGQPAR